jgi:hypothetical protein
MPGHVLPSVASSNQIALPTQASSIDPMPPFAPAINRR